MRGRAYKLKLGKTPSDLTKTAVFATHTAANLTLPANVKPQPSSFTMALLTQSSRSGGSECYRLSPMTFFFSLLLIFPRIESYQNLRTQLVGVDQRLLQGFDQVQFVTQCQDDLTSTAVLEDDLLSQVEFTDWVVEICETEGVTCPFELSADPVFSNLKLELALPFLLLSCDPFADREACVTGLMNMLEADGEFGFDITGLTVADVNTKIEGFCTDIFPCFVETEAPTPSPTGAGGTPTPVTNPNPAPAPTELGGSDSSDLSGGAIAGIAIGSTVFLVLVALLVRRRRNNKNADRELPPAVMEVKGDESIFTENSGEIYTSPQNTAGSTFDEGSDDSPSARTGLQSEATAKFTNVSTISQRAAVFFDPASNTGVVMEAPKEEEEEQKPKATGLQQKVNELDHAIDIGDWDAVYKISSTLSDKDDVSSHRSGSTSSSRGGRQHLSPADQKKAAELENLVEAGDWEAVATMAAGFTGISSGEVSLASSAFNESDGEGLGDDDARVGADPRNKDSDQFDKAAAKFAEVRESEDAKAEKTEALAPTTPTRRSLKDFVGGGGTSPAAAGALSNSGEDAAGIIGASPRGVEAGGAGAATAAAAAATAATAAAVASSQKDDGKKQKQRSIKKSIRNIFTKRSNRDLMIDNMEGTPGSFDSQDAPAGVFNDLVQDPLRSPSPISSGMSTPIDPQMTEEFEKMIAENDWKGLAEMAAKEVDAEEAAAKGETVNLRPTPPSEKREHGIRRFPSLHGAKVLIPFWEKLIDEVEAERKAGLGTMEEETNEQDIQNEELFGRGGGPPEVTPEKGKSPPGSPVRSHTKETYDAAAAFAKAWNTLKEEGGEEGAKDLSPSVTEWATKKAAKDAASAPDHELV